MWVVSAMLLYTSHIVAGRYRSLFPKVKRASYVRPLTGQEAFMPLLHRHTYVRHIALSESLQSFRHPSVTETLSH